MPYILIPIFMLLVLVALIVNAGRQVFLWLKLAFPHIPPVLYSMVYGLVVLAILVIFFASFLDNNPVPRWLLTGSHYTLGVGLYFLMIVNGISLLLLLGQLLRLIPVPMPQGIRLWSGVVALVLVVGVCVYGLAHAADLKTKSYAVTIQGTEAAELKISLVSDLHLGYVVGEDRLKDMVDQINAMEPDVVCIAGDVFDGDMTALSDPESLLAIFRELEATYGVYACLGNHDAGETYDEMLEFLEAANVRVLMDEAVVIDERFVLVGRRDSSPIGSHGEGRMSVTGLPEDHDLPVIVMDHQPGNIRQYGTETDLILCGHTHRGQLFPFGLITDTLFEVDYGYYRADEMAPQVIVTSGAGTWGPAMRTASDSEVVEINITFTAGQ